MRKWRKKSAQHGKIYFIGIHCPNEFDNDGVDQSNKNRLKVSSFVEMCIFTDSLAIFYLEVLWCIKIFGELKCWQEQHIVGIDENGWING